MRMVRRGAWALAAVGFASLLLWLIAGRPGSSQAVDTSCHNPRNLFAPGVTRISALFSFEVRSSSKDDWPQLTLLLEEFANSRQWSFRNTSRSEPGVVDTVEISICSSDQPVIVVNERHWAARPSSLPPARTNVAIILYGSVAEDVWRPVAVELVDMFESSWPNGLRFLDGGGNEIDPPDFLGKAEADQR